MPGFDQESSQIMDTRNTVRDLLKFSNSIIRNQQKAEVNNEKGSWLHLYNNSYRYIIDIIKQVLSYISGYM